MKIFGFLILLGICHICAESQTWELLGGNTAGDYTAACLAGDNIYLGTIPGITIISDQGKSLKKILPFNDSVAIIKSINICDKAYLGGFNYDGTPVIYEFTGPNGDPRNIELPSPATSYFKMMNFRNKLLLYEGCNLFYPDGSDSKLKAHSFGKKFSKIGVFKDMIVSVNDSSLLFIDTLFKEVKTISFGDKISGFDTACGRYFVYLSSGAIRYSDDPAVEPGVYKYELGGFAITSIKSAGSDIYATAVDKSGNVLLCRSDQNGENIKIIDDGFGASSQFFVSGTNLLIIKNGTLYISDDKGTTFRRPQGSSLPFSQLYTVKQSGNNILIATKEEALFVSFDSGNSLNPASGGLQSYPVYYTELNDHLAVVTESDMMIAELPDLNWRKAVAPSGAISSDFAIRDSELFIGTDRGVFRSSNYGADWTASGEGSENLTVTALFADAGIILAGTDTSGIFYSTDAGRNWISADGSTKSGRVTYINRIGSSLIAGTAKAELYRSTDGGFTWKCAIGGDIGGREVYNICGIDSCLFVSFTGHTEFYKSHDGGYAWYSILSRLDPAALQSGISLGAYERTLYALGQGIEKSEDYGENWSFFADSDDDEKIVSFKIIGSYLYASSIPEKFKRTSLGFLSANDMFQGESIELSVRPSLVHESAEIISGEELSECVVTDILGRNIANVGTNFSNSIRADFSGFADGVYIVSVKTVSGKVLRGKFIKN